MTTRSARARRAGQADEVGDEVEPGLYARPERDQPARQPAGGTAARHAGHVDARLAPVAVRHLDQAPPEQLDLLGRGALLRPEHRCGVGEARRDVAGDDELDPSQRGRRAHGLVGAEAAVGGGRPAAADDDAASPRVAGGQEELADAGGGGAHRVVAPRAREEGAPRCPGHLDDGGQRRPAVPPVQRAPLGLHPGAERARHQWWCAGCRPGRRAAPHRRRTSVPRPPSTPPPALRRPPPPPPRPPTWSPGICPARRPGGARGRSYRLRCRGSWGAGERTRTSTPFRGPGPKPGASASSATPAAAPSCG